MNTWRDLVALIQRDPIAFWSMIAFWWLTLCFAACLAYFLRGKQDKGKMDGLEQRLLGALERVKYVKEKSADLRGAYEAEWQARVNNEKPEVVERSVGRTRKAFYDLDQANNAPGESSEKLRKARLHYRANGTLQEDRIPGTAQRSSRPPLRS